MDVQCERCKTEYDFDDALVSGRGTTVRCTHCGHQFKVRRPEAVDGAGDRWVVQASNGQQLTFLTLRELQRAILAKQVTRSDLLVLAGVPPRPLHQIEELGPFFDGRASSRPPRGLPDGADGRFLASPTVPVRRTQSFGTPVEPRPISTAPTAPAVALPVEPMLAPTTPLDMTPSLLPPPTVPVRRRMPSADDELQDVHSAFPASTDEPFDIPRRRRVGGWVVAFVLLLAVGVVGWVVAKPYLTAPGAAAGPRLDARAEAFAIQGEKAMAEGDLDAAQEYFDKASALAERDPRVLLDEARVSTARADVPWLKLRLLPIEATDEVRTTKAQLDDRVARARKAAEDAVSAARDDGAAARTKIDALRLVGEQETARTYVPKLGGMASQAESAYVLAMLDLAETAPFWTTVIDRLRLAAASEGNAARAHAALVYALAKSGDVSGAKSELAKLDLLARPYALLPNLHAFVDRALPRASLPRGSAPTASHGNANSPPTQAPTPPAASGTSASEGPPGELTGGMQAASQAIKKGDWSRARRIYEALVARSPGDSEALSGIGDVDRAQGDPAGAIKAYKRALAVNPSYLPALLGVADTQWASGDQAAAQHSYKDVVDRFPEGTYPSYVKTRSEPSPPTTPAPPPAPMTSKPWDPGNGI
jgi:predicted Zn finger-like uncharacterized protein